MTLVAVGKGVPVERLREALSVGLGELGENRVAEAEPKIAALEGARWHMLGRIQSNKARRVVELFDEVHAVDSLGLAERLDRFAGEAAPARRRPIYLQVNVDADPAKAGFETAELERDLERLAGLPNLELRGLMTVGRLVPTAAAARPTFSALRELSERLRAGQPALGPGLSMGMSADYEVAIEEGATLVRIGRALFGERVSAG